MEGLHGSANTHWNYELTLCCICNIELDECLGRFIESLLSFFRMHWGHEPFCGRAAFHRRPSLVLEEWVAVERNPRGFMGSWQPRASDASPLVRTRAQCP